MAAASNVPQLSSFGRGRRLRRASQMIRETRITRGVASHAQATGLSFIPQAAESEFISVPVTSAANVRLQPDRHGQAE
jgi:hypothetical protein